MVSFCNVLVLPVNSPDSCYPLTQLSGRLNHSVYLNVVALLKSPLSHYNFCAFDKSHYMDKSLVSVWVSHFYFSYVHKPITITDLFEIAS